MDKELFREKTETHEKVNLWASFRIAGLVISQSHEIGYYTEVDWVQPHEGQLGQKYIFF